MCVGVGVNGCMRECNGLVGVGVGVNGCMRECNGLVGVGVSTCVLDNLALGSSLKGACHTCHSMTQQTGMQ